MADAVCNERWDYIATIKQTLINLKSKHPISLEDCHPRKSAKPVPLGDHFDRLAGRNGNGIR